MTSRHLRSLLQAPFLLILSLLVTREATAEPPNIEGNRSNASFLQGYAPLDALTLEALETVSALDNHNFDLSLGVVGTIPLDDSTQNRPSEASPFIGIQLPFMFDARNYYAPSVPRAKLRAIRETRIPALEQELKDEQSKIKSRIDDISREVTRLERELATARSRASELQPGTSEYQESEERISKLLYLHTRAQLEAERLEREAALLESVPVRIKQLQLFVKTWEKELADTVNSYLLSASLDAGILLLDLLKQRAHFTYGFSYRIRDSVGISIGCVLSPRLEGFYLGLTFNTNFFHVFHSGYRNDNLDPSVLFSKPPSNL